MEGLIATTRLQVRLDDTARTVEIGADGPSQMGLEDLAMIAATQGSTVLYPSDATSTAALVAEMADISGVSYLRAHLDEQLRAVREEAPADAAPHSDAWGGE